MNDNAPRCLLEKYDFIQFLLWLCIRKPTIVCKSIGTLKIINFPFVPNGKLIILSLSQNLST